MSPSIEQLIEFNVQDVVKIIAEEKSCSVEQAMNEFYLSKVYDGLVDPETGLYLQSPAYLYELLLETQGD
ncbi:hypothetical protein [Adlercreutzia sp. ZJ141]|uniref:hypothetical protein n=1 Tax=Adlercreutzia sp. ZJ141 TaxID=2709406 RepID=UPI001981680E|nr:hypothetical protein [Adlercreutzia sp. ZJ141]